MFRLPILLLVLAFAASSQISREQRLIVELERDPQNVPKILQLASLKLEEASGIADGVERASKLDEVQILYLKANSIDSRNVDALYHLGIVSWMKVFPAVVAARREAAMDPETPGPVRDRSSRAVLNAKYRADIDYAIATLEQAIALDPSNNDAMAYLQMAYRARADLKDTLSQWEEDQNAAGRWREKAYDIGSAKQRISVPEPQRPAQPPSWAVVFLPSAMAVDSAEMEKRLIHWTPGVCPAGLHLEGAAPAIALSAVIDRDGSVLYLERSDGPIELADSAIESAKHWTYKPALMMNGNAVMVKTTVVVPFAPCPAN